MRYCGRTIRGANLLHILAEYGDGQTAEIIGMDTLRNLDVTVRNNDGYLPAEVLRQRLNIPTDLLRMFEELEATGTAA